MDRLKKRKEIFYQVDVYPVVTSSFCSGRTSLEVVKQVLVGGAKIVQLREKDWTKKAFFELAEKARSLTDRYQALLIINDYIDIALGADADGVHLGQEDFPLIKAKTLAPKLLIGISTHNLEEALQAEKHGADYINVGPIFPTQTKTHLSQGIGTTTLKAIAKKISIPVTVMGGIKQANLEQVLQAGAKKVAMVTEITQAEDIVGVVQNIRQHIDSYYEYKKKSIIY